MNNRPGPSPSNSNNNYGPKYLEIMHLFFFVGALFVMIYFAITDMKYLEMIGTTLITFMLIGCSFNAKYNYPRIPWLVIGGFIVFLILVETAGHFVAERYRFPLAYAAGHAIVELLSGTIAYNWFKKKFPNFED